MKNLFLLVVVGLAAAAVFGVFFGWPVTGLASVPAPVGQEAHTFSGLSSGAYQSGGYFVYKDFALVVNYYGEETTRIKVNVSDAQGLNFDYTKDNLGKPLVIEGSGEKKTVMLNVANVAFPVTDSQYEFHPNLTVKVEADQPVYVLPPSSFSAQGTGQTVAEATENAWQAFGFDPPVVEVAEKKIFPYAIFWRNLAAFPDGWDTRISIWNKGQSAVKTKLTYRPDYNRVFNKSSCQSTDISGLFSQEVNLGPGQSQFYFLRNILGSTLESSQQTEGLVEFEPLSGSLNDLNIDLSVLPLSGGTRICATAISSPTPLPTVPSTTPVLSVITIDDPGNLPPLPPLSISLGETESRGRKVDPNRMPTDGYRTIFVKNAATGANYPDYWQVSYRGETYTASVQLLFRIRRGDGVECSSSVYVGCALPMANISYGQAVFGVDTVLGNGEICAADFYGQCQSNLERSDLPKGVPIPGPVILEGLRAQARFNFKNPGGGSSIDQVAISPEIQPGTKLFTVAEPPRISGLTPVSVKHGETFVINGANFDASLAGKWIYANRALANMNYQTREADRTLDGNFLHYCSPSKFKMEFPNDLSSGRYTLTIFNEFGYSNKAEIELQSGEETPENDPNCSGGGGTISGLTPSSGPVGTSVLIKGSGFGSATSGATANVVKFNGVSTAVQGVSLGGTELRVLVPPGATTGPVTVIPAGMFPIVGPVFTVTEGGGDEEGDNGESAMPQVERFFPPRLNIGSDNVFLILGNGFANPQLSSSNPAVNFSEVETNEEGTMIRGVARISQTDPQSVAININQGGGMTATEVILAIKPAGSPVVTGVQISPLNAYQEAELTLTGEIPGPITGLEVVGIQAVVTSFEKMSDGEVKVQLAFDRWLTEKPRLFSLFPTARAGEENKGVGKICTTGCQTFKVNAPKIAAAGGEPTDEETKGRFVNAFSFGIDNPFKGQIDNFTDLLGVIATFIFQLGIPVAVIIIIYSGIMMLVSGGNPKVYQKGVNGLKYAALGLVVLLIGKGFVELIRSLLDVTGE